MQVMLSNGLFSCLCVNNFHSFTSISYRLQQSYRSIAHQTSAIQSLLLLKASDSGPSRANIQGEGAAAQYVYSYRWERALDEARHHTLLMRRALWRLETSATRTRYSTHHAVSYDIRIQQLQRLLLDIQTQGQLLEDALVRASDEGLAYVSIISSTCLGKNIALIPPPATYDRPLCRPVFPVLLMSN